MVTMARGDEAGALHWLASSIGIQGNNVEAIYWASLLSLKLRRFGDAEGFARRLTEVSPKNARGHYFLSSALAALNRIEEAVAAIDLSLSIDPNEPDSLVLKARLLNTWKMPGLAVDFYRRAISIRPSPSASVDLAQVLLRDSRPEEALEFLLPVLKMVPESARPYDLVARALTETRQFADAEDYCSSCPCNVGNCSRAICNSGSDSDRGY